MRAGVIVPIVAAGVAGLAVGLALAAPGYVAEPGIEAGTWDWYFRLRFFALWCAFPMVACLFMVPVFGLVCVSGRWRRGSAMGLSFCGMAVAGSVFLIRVAGYQRLQAFAEMADRLQPVVEALNSYDAERGGPAETLEALVPDWIEAIPGTGMTVYPELQYEVAGDEAVFDTRWTLYVPCGQGIMNWDVFFYQPDETYPDQTQGGVVERVGRWAYVHE